jgi:hypothetical protein
MKFRVTDEASWEREFVANTSSELAAGVRRAWDERIQESPLARVSTAGTVGGVHPAFAFCARKAWIGRWFEERMARATPTSDVRSWKAQAALWLHQAKVELGADEILSPLRLHVWAPGDAGGISVWSTLAIRSSGGQWSCSPAAPRVGRAVNATRAQELYDGAEVICEHARNLGLLAEHVGDAIRQDRAPLRLIRCAR